MQRTTEDYLKTVYLLAKKQNSVRGVMLAESLGVSRSTVSVKVKRLVEDGFAVMNGEHEIFLTAKGKKIAEDVLERHTTISALLEELGVDEKIASRDACEMEHAVSPESFEALKRLTKEGREKQEK